MGVEIFRFRPDLTRGSAKHLYYGYKDFPGVKRPEYGVDHTYDLLVPGNESKELYVPLLGLRCLIPAMAVSNPAVDVDILLRYVDSGLCDELITRSGEFHGVCLARKFYLLYSPSVTLWHVVATDVLLSQLGNYLKSEVEIQDVYFIASISTAAAARAFITH